MKTLLILLDGMRPDAIDNLAFTQKLKKESTYCMKSQTVMPSATLPCHMSLFHSVAPERHGTTTNTYAPQVRPISGLCEQLSVAGKTCSFYYDWQELRDLTRARFPASLAESHFLCADVLGSQTTKDRNYAAFLSRVFDGIDTDFTFLYAGWPDAAGHEFGWMTDGYMHAIEECWKSVESVISKLPRGYSVIITADHGGHDRTHGTAMPEDMTIPIFFMGESFEKGKELDECSILDIAPTICNIMGVEPSPEWDGHSII